MSVDEWSTVVFTDADRIDLARELTEWHQQLERESLDRSNKKTGAVDACIAEVKSTLSTLIALVNDTRCTPKMFSCRYLEKRDTLSVVNAKRCFAVYDNTDTRRLNALRNLRNVSMIMCTRVLSAVEPDEMLC